MLAGVPWIGAESAKLISEKLLADPALNKEAQLEIKELAKSGVVIDQDKLASAVKKLKFKTVAKGKTNKSGAELFAKVLVPNKPIKNQFQARLIAALANINLHTTTKSEYQRVAKFLNQLIEANNKIYSNFKSGDRDDLEGYSPALPKRIVTPSQLEKDYRKFKPEIDRFNGINTHRIDK